jgi:hypothetical protein
MELSPLLVAVDPEIRQASPAESWVPTGWILRLEVPLDKAQPRSATDAAFARRETRATGAASTRGRSLDLTDAVLHWVSSPTDNIPSG